MQGRGAASPCACPRSMRRAVSASRSASSTSTSRRESGPASTCVWPGRAAPGFGGAPAGDLFLEIGFNPHPRFRVDGRDVYADLALSPWEAALGATVDVPTPEGSVQLSVPAGSAAGRKLRLKGKGIPGQTPGDFYVVLAVALPRADTQAAKDAYAALAKAFESFNPRN